MKLGAVLKKGIQKLKPTRMGEVTKQETVKKTAAAATPFVRYDDYWLQKARTMIDGSIDVFTKRLKTLNNFLNYLATGTFLGGVSYTTYLESDRLEVYILFIIPLIVIAIAKYYVSVKGSEPAMQEVDMRSPTKINEEYNDILGTLAEQVKEAGRLVAIATGFVLFCLPLAVYFQNHKKTIEPPVNYTSVQYDGSNLNLQANLQKAEKVSLILYGTDAKKKPKTVYSDILLQKPGELSKTIEIADLKLQLDSLDMLYTVDGKVQRHTFRPTAIKKPAAKTPAETQKKKKEVKKDSAAAKGG